MYPFGYYHLFHPRTRYTWHKVHILHETEKAILVTAPFVIASEAKQSQMELGELTFNLGGKQSFFVERETGNGKREIYVREALYRSLAASAAVGSSKVEVGRKAKPASNIELRTSK